MTAPDDGTRLPPTGAFPGYKLGEALFVTFASLLRRQANIANASWSKLLEGKYQMQDWYNALAQSLQASAGAAEQMFSTISGAGSPPWASLGWPPTEERPVRLRRMVDTTDPPIVSRLSRLGGGEGSYIPEVEATYKGPYSLVVWLKTSEATPTPGQYIGFVTTKRDPEPLVILTVSIPE